MRDSDSEGEPTPAQASGSSTVDATEAEHGTEDTQSDDGAQSRRDRVPLPRRTALASLIGFGSLGLLGGRATAQQGTRPWRTDVNANGNTLFDLGTLELIDGPRVGTTDDTALEGIVGDERFLEVTPTPTGIAPIIVAGHLSNSAGQNALGATIAGGGNANAPNEVTANYAFIGAGQGNTASGERAVLGGGGNNTASGLLATVGGGLANDATEELATVGGGNGNSATGELSTVGGGQRNDATGELSTVGGGRGNEVTDDSDYGTVSGGRDNAVGSSFDTPDFATVGGGQSNEVLGRGATVSGGCDNVAQYKQSTVGGGEDNVSRDETSLEGYTTVGGGDTNRALATWATVGGGVDNEASGEGATVGGGSTNVASGQASTVGGGAGNTTRGFNATVAGGTANVAEGSNAMIPGGIRNIAEDSSFAGGKDAWAVDNRTFVWNDSSSYHFNEEFEAFGLSSAKDIAGSGVTGDSTFHASAGGGFRFITSPDTVTYIAGGSAGWSTTSTRAAKTNVDPVDPDEVLAGVEEMEVATWEYRDDDGGGRGVRHIGPMAEEFHEAVDVGDSDEHINSINADGVALAAIQGLSAKLDEKDERIDELERRTDELERENEQLRERLTSVEDQLAEMDTANPPSASGD